jgi:Co/Zn/Cd efflux system component
MAGDILVAITKIIAATWTGSAAMASEAIHSVVDIGNEILLLYGNYRSRQRPDGIHPMAMDGSFTSGATLSHSLCSRLAPVFRFSKASNTF